MSGAIGKLRTLREEGRAVGMSLEGLRTVPGWVVRVAAGLAGALVLLGAGFHRLGPPAGALVAWLAVLLWAASVVRPREGYVGVLLLLVGLRVLALAPLGVLPLAALLLVAHLTLVLGALAARTPAAAKVEAAVPLRLLRAGWRAQVLAQALALAAQAVTVTSAGGGVWRVAALAAAVALVLVVLPPRRR